MSCCAYVVVNTNLLLKFLILSLSMNFVDYVFNMAWHDFKKSKIKKMRRSFWFFKNLNLIKLFYLITLIYSI